MDGNGLSVLVSGEHNANIPSADCTEGITIGSLDGLRINILIVKEL